jgi:hypothetical protein
MDTVTNSNTQLHPAGPCALTSFPWYHKLLMRICLYGFMLTGEYAVLRLSFFWGLMYIAFLVLAGLIILYCFCGHCPYPREHHTCLMLPWQVVTPFSHAPARKMNRAEITAFIVVLAGVIAFPQYWLWQQPRLLALYLILFLPACIAFPLYYCRRCLHHDCPFNRSAA